MGGRNPWPDVPRNQNNGRFKSRGGGCLILFLPVIVSLVILLGRR
jgi:hypothetical protein